jgi:putative nucleotidyltransferase with HDIG domain
MDRINKILLNEKFNTFMDKNIIAEKDRIFCHHNLNHLLDVARIAYILALEENMYIEKDIIYATALLHDIGRWKEYESGQDHAIVSSELCEDILFEVNFTEEEVKLIKDAIKNHRNRDNHKSKLSAIIYESDKVSRFCGDCEGKTQCKRFLKGEEYKFIY